MIFYDDYPVFIDFFGFLFFDFLFPISSFYIYRMCEQPFVRHVGAFLWAVSFVSCANTIRFFISSYPSSSLLAHNADIRSGRLDQACHRDES